MDRASAYYRIRGDVGPLQVETVHFLRKIVDKAYADAVQAEQAGLLKPRLSLREAIGNFVDKTVRRQLVDLYGLHDIPYGPGRQVKINNREYDTSAPQKTYRIPDARVGNIYFDWTITSETETTAQVHGFFSADSKPIGVIIIQPSQTTRDSTYYIPRPQNFRRNQ